MKSAKAREQLLKKKKRRLEANVAAGDRFLDEVPSWRVASKFEILSAQQFVGGTEGSGILQ